MESGDSSAKDLDDASSSKVVDRLSEYEQLGQSVVMGKKVLIELDIRRQKCREAVRALRTNKESQGDKSWVCLGSTTFIKLPTEQSIGFIEEDIKTINSTIDAARNELKKNVDELKQMEGNKDLDTLGFNLRPVA